AAQRGDTAAGRAERRDGSAGWLAAVRQPGQSWLVASLHALIVAVSLVAACFIAFNFTIPPGDRRLLLLALAVAVPLKLLAFVFLGLHRRWWWRLVDLEDVFRIFTANVAASAIFALAALTISRSSLPASAYVVDFLVCFLMTAGARVGWRFYET